MIWLYHAVKVFKAMLQGDYCETVSPMIEITDCTEMAAQQIIHYLCYDMCDAISNDSPESVPLLLDILEAADKYGLQGLIDNCTARIAQNIRKDNALDIYRVARIVDSGQLLEECANFFRGCPASEIVPFF